ncbi:MAG TPA: hypothetical protein PKN32_00075 [Bacteroidales bacterium]|nr:hypothetical protein [Bacteroidales bacterium]
MSSSKNIEDFFRSEFDEFKVNPSGKVWSGINKRLTVPRFNAIYKNAFNGFRLSPSEHVWRRVAAFVWLNKFIHFTPFSFNIYYLGIIVTAVVGTVITVNNNPNLNFVHFDANSINIESNDNSNDLFNIPNPSEYLDYYLAQTNATVDITNVAYLQNNNDNLSDDTKTIIIPTIIDNTDNQISEPNILIQNQHNENINIQNNLSELSNAITSNELNEEIENNILLEEKLKETESLQIEEIITKSELLPPKLVRNITYSLKYHPDWSEFADLKLSEIPYQNPIVYDTIGYNHVGEPIIIEKSWFTVDLFYSPYLNSYSNKLLNSELEQNYNFYSANNKPAYTYSVGLGVSFNYNRFRLESGFSYLQMPENLNQIIKVYDTVTTYQYNYFENHNWDYDTIMILDLDEYLQGNIVYIEYVDSCMFYFTDSVLLTHRDSVQIDKLINAENTYHIVDVPIIVGYEFSYGNLSITPKAGLITSFLTKRAGTGYNIMSGEIVNATDLPSNTILFDYYAGINFQYRISKNTAIFIEPHLRSDINSLYKSSYAISEKSMKYGLKTGISIRF